MTEPLEPVDVGSAGGKADRVFKHALYEIATGAWAPGTRLPSLREAHDRWGVNHLTVRAAYRRLEELGLVRSVPRSGYFVCAHDDLDRLGRHREELGRRFERIRRGLVADGLSVLGAFRWFARLAEAAARDRPECAFAECTRFQAEMHAREVSDRLEVPCLPVTTGGLRDGARLPKELRTILTTSYHRQEVTEGAPDRRVHVVPIELSASLPEKLREANRPVLVLATDAETARHAARDARRQLGRGAPAIRSAGATPDDLDRRLDATFSRRAPRAKARAAVLSPTLWSALDEERRRKVVAFPFAYGIGEAAWPGIADALGLPLGAIG
jgi:DNA-binding transcriptional regulator YhcF (GntR family)